MRTSRISATVGLILILGCSENSPQSFTSSPYAPIDSATAASALAGAARLCGADGADDAQSAQLLFGHLSADGDRLNDQEVAQAQLILAGLAQSPATAELNWQEWIEACDRKQPTLASLYLEAASRSQGSASSNIAKHFDLRRTSDQLRLQVQKVLWAYSPSFDGFNSTRKLFFKEKPRANSPLRLNIISQVLAHNFSPQSEELLLQVVERSNFGDFERRTADSTEYWA